MNNNVSFEEVDKAFNMFCNKYKHHSGAVVILRDNIWRDLFYIYHDSTFNDVDVEQTFQGFHVVCCDIDSYLKIMKEMSNYLDDENISSFINRLDKAKQEYKGEACIFV